MKTCLTLSAVLFAYGIGIAQADDSFRARLERAASASGAEYIAARNQLVATESNAVAELAAISTNTQETWQIRLMAGIVAERLKRGAAINDLVGCDWTKDPEYNREWEKYACGPVMQLSPLVTKRCKENGLWWYYMEVVWKEIREYSKTPRMNDDDWRSAYTAACRGSPVYELILKVTEERIRRDIDFRKWETRGALAFLQNSKTNTVLPFLLEILPHIPVADERNRPERAIKWINTLAAPQDVPMIEDFYKKRGEQVPEAVIPKLKALKERAAALSPK